MTTDSQRSVEERVARHLAARDWLTDDDRWVNSTAAFRADYLTAAREVIALVREGEPVVPAVVLPPAPRADEAQPDDRAALRDRIAHALEREDAINAGYDHGFVSQYGVDPETDGFVDAVLAVLPAPADRCRTAWLNARNRARVLSAEVTRRAPLLGEYAAEIERLRTMYDAATAREHDLIEERDELRRKLAACERIRENADFHLGQEMARRQLAEKEAARLWAELAAPADRAAVLREAADALDESETLRDLTDDHMHDVHAAANELRRMADEAQQHPASPPA
ncbi:hypothetical protein ACFVAF_25475 [Streptomyces sp. NPDC057596]|uniref:hypothetical protein n=1 Tax=Streptomyces sp. NPDC057596 TaxID=3346178 RepID=UPI0036B178DF